MDKEKKTFAEIAREERKARIKKASLTQSEKRERRANISIAKKRVRIIVPSVIIAVALVFGLLFYFGVPHRMLSAVKLADGTKISVAEYEFYYKNAYNNIVNTAYQYEQYYGSYYGEGAGLQLTGFDYKKTPASQEYVGEEKLDEKYGKKPTWADYLEHMTIETVSEIASLYAAATEAGYKLTEDDKKEISDSIEALRKQAADENYTLNAYLLQNYGRGMNEKLYRQINEKIAVISAYDKDMQVKLAEEITDEKIKETYDKDPIPYMVASIRVFQISSEVAVKAEGEEITNEELAKRTKELKEKALADANDFYDSATADNFKTLSIKYAPEAEKKSYEDDQITLIEGLDKQSASNYFTEEAAKWIFDDRAKVGQKKLITEENENGTVNCTILLIIKEPYRDDTLQPVNVRHILFVTSETKTDENGVGETVQKRTLAEAKKLAEENLTEWKKNPTEEHFIKLASEKSEDPGSSDNGGLIEDITTTSSYVPTFLEWTFAEGRKVGDTGIVESPYGYHIMYMSKISDKAIWERTITEKLTADAYNDFYVKTAQNKKFAPTPSEFLIKKVQKTVESYATKIIANIKAQEDAAKAQANPQVPIN